MRGSDEADRDAGLLAGVDRVRPIAIRPIAEGGEH
jgi:hypothetical protein